MIIPDRFRSAVRAHMARLDRRGDLYLHLSTPLILCVEGPPGVGKSTQLGQCLRELGSPFVRLDTSQLGGQFEGDPVRELDEALSALRDDFRGGPRPALVVDDLDMGLGVHSARTYTVNNQLTCGWLMARADEVYEPGFGPDRPAILVTGNDFSGVHGPLLRSGRARVFGYSPTAEEVAAALEPAFAAHIEGDRAAIAEACPGATIAEVLEAVSSLRDRWVADSPRPQGAFGPLPKIAAEEVAGALIRLREGSR